MLIPSSRFCSVSLAVIDTSFVSSCSSFYCAMKIALSILQCKVCYKIKHVFYIVAATNFSVGAATVLPTSFSFGAQLREVEIKQKACNILYRNTNFALITGA